MKYIADNTYLLIHTHINLSKNQCIRNRYWIIFWNHIGQAYYIFWELETLWLWKGKLGIEAHVYLYADKKVNSVLWVNPWDLNQRLLYIIQAVDTRQSRHACGTEPKSSALFPHFSIQLLINCFSFINFSIQLYSISINFFSLKTSFPFQYPFLTIFIWKTFSSIFHWFPCQPWLYF